MLPNGDSYEGVQVIDVDPVKDLALVKIKAYKLSVAVMGDSDELVVGQKVYTIGAPKGLEQTLSEGLVSAFRQMQGHRRIQTSAPISHGSSGGGMFDDRGRLVGITAAGIDEAQNLN